MTGARQQYDKDRAMWDSLRAFTKWQGMSMPRCVICGAMDYKIVTYPRFTTDRFSRERITMQVRCNVCSVEATARRSNGGWSFKMQS
jgi:hypothetical protein